MLLFSCVQSAAARVSAFVLAAFFPFSTGAPATLIPPSAADSRAADASAADPAGSASAETVSSYKKPSFLPLNLKTCNIVPSSFQSAGLSDYWAQELTGSDLLKEELIKTPPPERPLVTVLDSAFDDHGLLVKALVSGKGRHAALPETKAVSFSDLSSFTSAKLSPDPPSFINFSIAWDEMIGGVPIRETSRYYDLFQSLSPASVIVSAAGNSYPRRQAKMMSLASKDFDLIAVGSLAPDGFVSLFSVSGEEVFILAPSDSRLASFLNGRPARFGGTSGAAPQVTAALAAFEWLSGYHPDSYEAKHLLRKTATPVPHSHEKPRKNGFGLLNAYKLGRIGLRLREMCSAEDAACFQKAIRGRDLFHFEENPPLLSDWNRAFPACSLEKGSRSRPFHDGSREALSEPARVSHPVLDPACREKAKAFSRMRKAALLNPGQRRFWEALSCVYEEAGFFENAKALNAVALSTGSAEEALSALHSLFEAGEASAGLLRAVHNMGGEAFPLFERALFNNSIPSYKSADLALFAVETGGSYGERILRRLAEDRSAVVRASAAGAAGMTGEAGLEILELLAFDGNLYVRSEAASALGMIVRGFFEEPVENDARPRDAVRRDSVRNGARPRDAVLSDAGRGRAAGLLRRILEQEESCQVKSRAAAAAGRLSGPEAEELSALALRGEPCREVIMAVSNQADWAAERGIEWDAVWLLLAERYSGGFSLEMVANDIISAAVRIGGARGAEILGRLLDSNDKMCGECPSRDSLLQSVLAALPKIGGTEACAVLQRIRDKNLPPVLLEDAAFAASKIRRQADETRLLNEACRI